MTIKELSKYYFISKNIDSINQRIETLNLTVISSSKINNTNISSSNKNESQTEKTALKLIKLKELLEKEKSKLVEEELMITEFINNIDDETIKYIIRARFIDGKSWNDIATTLNYSRPVPYQKLIKYLKERNK